MGRGRQSWPLPIRGAGKMKEPFFTGLESLNDRVARRSEVGGSVLARRVVTAPDVSALSAPAEMEPPSAYDLAIQTTGAARRSREVDSGFAVQQDPPFERSIICIIFTLAAFRC